MDNTFITVFTPTYNRSHMLDRLYESLKMQTSKNFEWIIVDDGSTDDTKLKVEKMKKDNILDIKYYYQLNGGKHRAINLGVSMSSAALFFIVDSDDFLDSKAIEVINTYNKPIIDDELFAGIIGVRVLSTGIPLVTSKSDYVDASSIDLHYKYKLSGDKAEVFKTSILKEYPFPCIPSEKFCSESLIWNRIGCKYIMRFINKPIYICNYQVGGLSYNSLKLRCNNPTYAILNYLESAQLNIPFIYKVKNALNFYRFKFHYKKKYSKKSEYILPFYFSIFKPLGLLLFIRDILKLKE